MIVCSCFGITDREIRAAFGRGGDGKCPAGQGCGNCEVHVREIVKEVRPREVANESERAPLTGALVRE